MKLYQSPEWAKFRERKLRADNYTCAKCDRTSEDDVVLQVHHISYEPMRKPWEYLLSDCLTLCKGCHAQEHGRVPPSEGWDQVWWEDLGDLGGVCDVCGTDIRYVFTIFHPHWPALDVGSDCCDRLTKTDLASQELRTVILRQKKKSRFIRSCQWTHRTEGLSYFYRGTWIDIVSRRGRYAISILGIDGHLRFDSAEDAKAEVFEIKENGKLGVFLSRCRPRRRRTV